MLVSGCQAFVPVTLSRKKALLVRDFQGKDALVCLNFQFLAGFSDGDAVVDLAPVGYWADASWFRVRRPYELLRGAATPASASAKRLSAGRSPINLLFDSPAGFLHAGIAWRQGFGAPDEELGFGHGDRRIGAR